MLQCLLVGLGLSAGAGADEDGPACCCAPEPCHCPIHTVPHVIAPGDRLSRLARQCGVDAALIEEENPALRGSEMAVGDVIALPVRECREPAAEAPHGEVRRGLRGRGRVALTFDAGADLGALDDLLEALRHRRARATFFITGRWVEHNPEAFRRILDDRHEVYSHSYSHRPFSQLTREEILEELDKTEQVFREAGARTSGPYYRAPFGDRDRRVLETTARAGWQSIYWTVDSLDSVGKPKTARQIVDRVVSAAHARDDFRSLDGAILLFHVSPKTTAQAIGPVIDRLREHDLRPVTLTRLLTPPRPERDWRPAPVTLMADTEDSPPPKEEARPEERDGY
jgi:peptidoglycan/xylan/chitin deacetylase (PgdA/CDA1 family)